MAYKANDQGDNDSNVGWGPLATLAADEVHQITLPVEPLGGGITICDKAPTCYGAEGEERGALEVP
jgi:hypothetical protein